MQFLFRYIFALKNKAIVRNCPLAWAMLLELFKIGRQQATKSRKVVMNKERSVLSDFMDKYVDLRQPQNKPLLAARGTIVRLKGRGRFSASFFG